ncbi:hypothetical protein H4R19_005208, partial [Coemansia spiralis]
DGGLGLLDPKQQSTAIFGTWLMEAFHPDSARWWSEASWNCFNHAIVQVGRPVALWSIGFKQIPPACTIQDPCLWYAIRVWRDLHGRAEDTKVLELLDIPPWRHRITARYRQRTTTRAAMSALVPSTLASVIELASRAADGDPRCTKALLLFQRDVEEGRAELLPKATAILCAPVDTLDPEHIRSNLVLAGTPLTAYNPHAARTHLRSPDHLPANTEHWRKDWVPTD